MSEQQPPPWPPTPPLPGGWAPQGPPQGAPPQGPQGAFEQGTFEQPPHPALIQPGSTPPPGAHAAHLSPHAASSGPQDGSRGAMLFAVAVALVVLACLAGALVLVASA